MTNPVIPTVKDFEQAKTDLSVISEIVNSGEAKDVSVGGGKKLPTLKKTMDRLAAHAPVRNRGAWLSGTTYTVNDIWKASTGIWYVTLTEYTSGENEQADVATNNVTVHQAVVNELVVKNVAELRARKGLKDGEHYFLQGHTEQGYGAGPVVVDLSDTTSEDDNGRVFVVDGNKRVKRISKGTGDPEEYGAIPDRESADAVQACIDNNRVTSLGAHTYYFNKPVYVRSDRVVLGKGCNYGGTVIINTHGGHTFIGGTPDNAVNTRIHIYGFKFLSQGLAPGVESYHIYMKKSFMNHIDDISFGDVDVGAIGQQQNGINIDGTAHTFGVIRGLRQNMSSDKPDTTGILGLFECSSCSFELLQFETGSKVVFSGASSNTITRLHGERSAVRFINSSNYNTCVGGYILDGDEGYSYIDNTCIGNDFTGVGAINFQFIDAGLFNVYQNSGLGNIGSTISKAGIGHSYVVNSQIGSSWNDYPVWGHKAPVAGWYFVAIALKNNTSTPEKTVTATLKKKGLSTALRTYSALLKTNAAATPQNVNSRAGVKVFYDLVELAKDDVVYLEESGNKLFLSPIENHNPNFAGDSGWGGSFNGYPGYFLKSGCTTSVADGKLSISVTQGMSFHVTQFFVPKQAAKYWLVAIKGRWSDENKVRLATGVSANDGSNVNSDAFAGNIELGSDKYLFGYVGVDDIKEPFRLSFGGYQSGVSKTETIELDWVVFCPVE